MHLPDWLNAIILGIIEGLTEFLPVSSTGHLLVTGQWLGFDSEVFNVFIQLGALLAVWWIFRHRLIRMIPWGRNASPQDFTLGLHVIIAFFPAALVGFFTHHWIKDHLFGAQPIAIAMIGGGITILLIESFKPRAMIDELHKITPSLALMVGLGQCLALYPGVSRSGATIMVGLLIGMSRSAATEFTFLLAVPTMTAAGLYELFKYRHDLSSHMIGLLGIGFIAAFVSAWIVVKWFIQFVQSHTFEGFAWYRIVAGAILLGMISNGFLHA